MYLWHILVTDSDMPLKTFCIYQQDYPQQFGIDWNGPTPNSQWDGDDVHLDDSAEISIPEIDPPLANTMNNRLNQFNPLADSQCCGLDIYMQVVSNLQTTLKR